jgi:hypothetical protein
MACFRRVWMVVVARGGPNHRKRALTLVFGWCGWLWWPAEGPSTKNERDRSFSVCVDGGGGKRRVVGSGGGQRKVQRPKTSGRARFRGGAGKRRAQPLKTSGCARFRGVWVVVSAGGRPNPQKRALWLVFGGVGGWW